MEVFVDSDASFKLQLQGRLVKTITSRINLCQCLREIQGFDQLVLLTHDKSVSIQSFRLVCMNNDDDHSIYKWINILAQRRVRQLHLEVASLTKTPFALPRYLITSHSLEVLGLDLNQGVLEIPSDVAFSRLKSLKLVDTQLSDQVLFQNFISCCPLLETLILQGCLFHDFEVLDISLRNLRKLVIDNGYCGGPFDQGLCKCDLKIACLNLVQFDLLGPLAKNIFWDKDPSFLQAAIIFAVSWEWNESDDEVLHEE
ncbi:F-box/FBD/LRR-repeat protein [Corchorus capsularis]|uniref:F-box/FBD/LRR-repeat protein n=1 Tax=Corchorus capsularis TaxID=210143 RepID=A0A1R3JAK0_COCAP|nr:F-box/FBD/LRR-repeat protein [Corchorus capsularis]